ncbi:MAG: glycyl-radical enzyme activating protein [Clostridiales bacterium]|jgi:glycyl-radical enzyme activating protein|nr:glycyl-radical enzyme activating protein [Clostridiales bacterium]
MKFTAELAKTQGSIFNIQRFSIHDGPGARTAVFFKGCNLRCRWCHNPESIDFAPSLEFYPDKCIGCGACFAVCPVSAHIIRATGADEQAIHTIDRSKCTRCLKCVETCYAGALAGVGQTVTADYIVDNVKSEMPYYQHSGGGVTFSGGECMAQPDFLYAVLVGCKEAGIHTAVDTAGNLPWSHFERILDLCDMVLYDMKAASPKVHRAMTGVDNKLIIENLRKLCKLGKRIWIRIPYIPDFNDGEIPGIADILCEIEAEAREAGRKNAFERVELIPFHKLGASKYEALGIGDPTDGIKPPSDAEVARVVEYLRERGLDAYKS